MRIYFDTCCLMRAFDDQSYPRVRLETLAISDLMDHVKSGKITWVSGKAVYLEVVACPSQLRRDKVLDWLHDVDEWQEYEPKAARMAKRLILKGISEWDARHLATAETAQCDWFLTTDQVLVRKMQKIHPRLKVKVANPTEPILEEQA